MPDTIPFSAYAFVGVCPCCGEEAPVTCGGEEAIDRDLGRLRQQWTSVAEKVAETHGTAIRLVRIGIVEDLSAGRVN